MGVIGKVAGTMLKDNLVRNGVDLQIDSNLMYYDIANRRVGINTITPGNALTVNGAATLSSIYINSSNLTAVTGNLVLNSLTGNIDVSNKIISYVAAPVGNLDATNKQYVDVLVDAIRYPNLYLGNSNSGNTNVVLNSETLNLVGVTNQINVAITESTATFSLASNLEIGNLNTTNGGQLVGYFSGPIGANAANTAAFTTATATGNISGANLIASGAGGQIVGYHTGAIGSNVANTGIFTNVTTTGSSGNISGANYIFASLFSGNLTGAVGNINPNSGVFTNVTTVSGGQLSGYLTGAIGANTPNTGVFTSVSTTNGGQLTGYHTGAIGANTANSGAFTTLSANSGNIANFYFNNNDISATNTDGNINIVPSGNGIVSMNTTTAVQIPVGSTFARPANPTKGMFRFNSASGSLEIYDGFSWNPIGGTQTSIVSSMFTGDGSTLNFTLSQDATTSGTIVSINGVTQIPDSVYYVTGNVLTFTEAPVSTDIIEARILTTTSSVASLSQGNSSVYFDPANSYAIKADVNGVTKLIVGTANTYIIGNLVTTNGITWANGLPYAGQGTVSSITADTTPINGISLSGGTITTSGTIGLTGALDLSSPPVIGATAPNTASFTALSTTGNITVVNTPVNSSALGEIQSGRLTGRYNTTKTNYFDYNNDGSVTSADSLLASKIESTFLSINLAGSEFLQPALGSNYGTKKVGVGFHVGTKNDVLNSSVSAATNYAGNVNAVILGYMNNGPRILLMDRALADDQANVAAYTSTYHRFYGSVGIGIANAAVALDVAGQIQGYHTGPIGANTPNTGAFTTVSANTHITVGAIQLWAANSTITGVTITGTSAGATGPLNGSLGAAQPNTVVATSIITTSGGQITGYHTGPIGANVANTGIFTSLSITGASTANSYTSTYGGQITGYLTGAIGANTANTGVFTTLTATSGYQGAVNGPFNGTIGASTPNSVVATSVITTSGGQITGYHTGPIGANTANTGAFTTLTTTGNTTLNNYANIYIANGSTSNTSALTIIGNIYGQGGSGYHDFLRVTSTFSGVTNPNKYFRLNSTGSIEIINSAYTTTLFTLTDVGNVTISGNTQTLSLGVGTGPSGTAGEIRATNNVTAYYSDDRLKTKLGNIENALEKLRSLNGFNYQPNETAQALGYVIKDEVGVSAQEVQKVLPSAVVPAPIDDKYLTVHYDRLIPLLIEAIKELTSKVERLEGK